ncbi:MAG: hypothetical protein ChlgKO_06990 [Chlamydiales bacterium]
MEKKILIVDDESDIVKIFSIVLKKEGYAVCTAKNGKEALEQVKDSDVCLIYLDYFLPDLTGEQIFQEMRKKKETTGIPVIFISASQEKLDEIKGDELTEKYVKPLVADQLLKITEKFVKN